MTLPDYNLDPPEDPPECPNEHPDGDPCDAPLERQGDEWVCLACRWTSEELAVDKTDEIVSMLRKTGLNVIVIDEDTGFAGLPVPQWLLRSETER